MNAVKLPRLIEPWMTKYPPSVRMMRVAKFERNPMIGMSNEKYPMIFKPISFDACAAFVNLVCSILSESTRRISAAPRILSLITALSQSMTS